MGNFAPVLLFLAIVAISINQSFLKKHMQNFKINNRFFYTMIFVIIMVVTICSIAYTYFLIMGYIH